MASRKFKKCILNMYKKFILYFDGHLFCILFNIRAYLKSLNVRFKYEQKNKKYAVIEDKICMYFFHKKQSIYAYYYGLKNRSENLNTDYFLDQINFRNGDTIIDCGANVGDFSLYFNYKKINIRYFGYEPSPSEYLCLKENLYNHYTHNIALWNKKSVLDFYVSSQNADSSLIEPHSYEKIIKVKTERLDNLFKNTKIRLLKLEAEGAEPEILLGAKSILHEINYISADLGFERGKMQESTFEEVCNFLLKNNFVLIKISQKRLTALFKNINFEKHK